MATTIGAAGAAHRELVRDLAYRVEWHFRLAGAVTSWLGAIAIFADYRATGGVLMALCVLCQIISWRAMRVAQTAGF